MKLMHRVLGLALLLAAVSGVTAGRVVVSAGYAYRPIAPVVVAPAPVVVVRRPYGYWW